MSGHWLSKISRGPSCGVGGSQVQVQARPVAPGRRGRPGPFKFGSRRRWWAVRSSTGGRRTGGSAARSRACVLAGPSRTWWPGPGLLPPGPGRPRRCAAPGTADSDSLLDAASYGIRWVLLSPAAAAGVSRDPPAGSGTRAALGCRPRPHPPAMTRTFGLPVVCGP
jgi:hypothetical protein